MSLIKQHAFTQDEMERIAKAAVAEYKAVLPFIEYCMDYYGPTSEFYRMEGLTKVDVFNAYKTYMFDCKIKKNYSWGDGDTVDRERICGYLLEKGFTFA